VNFYEQWTPGLRVSATPSIIQSGDASSVKAQLIDTVDGSLVREEGHTVNFYWDDSPAPVPTTLDFIPNRTILSYADHQFVQLVVDVYDQYGEGVHDVTVVFKKNGVVFDTKVTYYGTATCNYWSAGDGDVVFTAECEGLSESVTIEDCIWGHLTEETVTKSSTTTLTKEVQTGLQLSLPNKFSLEFELKSTLSDGYRTYLTPVQYKSENDPNYALFVQQTSSFYTVGYRTTSTTALISNTSVQGESYQKWKIVRDGNTFTYYINDVQVAQTTNLTWFDTYTPHTVVFNCWSTGSVSMKNIKVKPL